MKEKEVDMEHILDLSTVTEKNIYPLSDKYYGKDVINGRELSFTNYYMQMNGKPFMAVSGECHYARVHESQWEDTILKMKMCGINIISSYLFWIHHEEVEGKFRFDGNRNVRKFVELCKKHGLYVIVRIGPFNHGECRNGGIPDWMYGKPFEVRSCDERFLAYTKRWYQVIADELEGLFFKDGGPIIGTQLDNEYMHSAAPWELTTGVANEWLPTGSDGNAYMIQLKRLAKETGIDTPFYTATGWGGAATPTEEVLPLWGGYAYWPWIFYDYHGPHPKTPEYIYREYHNNEVPETYNFDPVYAPESFPYSCCEMGGGMSCFYNYRFQLPYESVDAMANIKLAGGCNFLGYYMFRGGSNPKGETIPYMNECQCPKISYDYQAAIGEYGQLRPSYYRLKNLHLFMKNYADQFADLKTVLQEGSQEIKPEDVDTLRYAVRTDGTRGFLFINNFQDHAECKDKLHESVTLKLANETIVFSDLSMAAGENAILPFNLKIEKYCLKHANVQPLSVIRENKEAVYFFFVPEGMKPEYVWSSEGITEISGTYDAKEERYTVTPDEGCMSCYTIEGAYGTVKIVTLTREQSLQFFEFEKEGRKSVMLCSCPVVFDGEKLHLENPQNDRADTELFIWPKQNLSFDSGKIQIERIDNEMFSGLKIIWPEHALSVKELMAEACGSGRYTVQIPERKEEDKDTVLQIDYRGDIGHLFQNGELLSDNFSNDAVWEIGLGEVWNPKAGNELTILITPKKVEASVDVSSTMAGRAEQISQAVAELRAVKLRYVSEVSVKIQE